MNLAFAGTPEFARVALAALHAAGHELSQVLTQPDRPAGRGLKLQASPVKQFAQTHGLPLVQPRSLRLDGKYPEDAHQAQQALQRAAPQLLVVAAYGLILPQWVLQLPPLGCLNIHGSLLPRWRGAAPIHRAIEAGDERTGITLMLMDEGLDTGPMLAKRELPILAHDTTASVHDQLAHMGADMVVQAVANCAAWAPQPQPSDGVSYAHKVDKAQARVDWSEPAAVVERRIRAFDPAPGCSGPVLGQDVKVWKAAVATGWGGMPGDCRVQEGRVWVHCGDAALEILQLQRAGGQRLPARIWLQALAVASGGG